MHPLSRSLLAALLAFAGFAVQAAGLSILIQTEPGGHHRFWYSEGAAQLTNDELVDLWDTAQPEGGHVMQSSAGPVRSFETPGGIVVELPATAAEKSLLLDRDNCGAVKVWHSGGSHQLNEEQVADLLIDALPEGSKAIPVGDLVAKSYIAKLGVVVVLWKPLKGAAAPKPNDARPPSSAK